MKKNNWLILTMGSQFATLTEFLDHWRHNNEEKCGPITRAFCITTDFTIQLKNGKEKNFDTVFKELKEELKKDTLDKKKRGKNFTVVADPSTIETDYRDDHIYIYKIKSPDEIPLRDIENLEEAKIANNFIIDLVGKISAERKKEENTSLLFCIAGGRKTMSADLALASVFFRDPGDKVYHLLVHPENNGFKYHLYHDNSTSKSFLVEYFSPRLSDMFQELSDKKVIENHYPGGQAENFAAIVEPVTAAIAGTAAQAFTRVHLIEDSSLKNAYINLVARWSTNTNQERLWGGDVYGYFVDHGFQHACRVIDKAGKFIETAKNEVSLSSEEVFVLFCACWLHDIGMSGTKKERSFKNVRKLHGRFSGEIIRNENNDYDEYDKIFSSPEFNTYREAIAEISAFHQKNQPLNEEQLEIEKKKCCANSEKSAALYCIPETMEIQGKKIRTRLLAALLQLADACDVTRERTVITAEEKHQRNLLSIEDKTAQITDRILFLISENQSDGQELKRHFQDLSKLGKISKETLLNKISILNSQCIKDTRLQDLFEELKLMADQYQNHYLLHSSVVSVDSAYDSIRIKPGLNNNTMSQDERNFYLRQIQKTIYQDLFLTFKDLHKHGFKIRKLEVESGLKKAREKRFKINEKFPDVSELLGLCKNFVLKTPNPIKITYEDYYFDTPSWRLEEKQSTYRLRKEKRVDLPERYTIKVKNESENLETEILITSEEYNKCIETGNLVDFEELSKKILPNDLQNEFFDSGKQLQSVLIITNRKAYTLEFTSDNLRESKIFITLDDCSARIEDKQFNFRQLELKEFFTLPDEFKALENSFESAGYQESKSKLKTLKEYFEG